MFRSFALSFVEVGRFVGKKGRKERNNIDKL